MRVVANKKVVAVVAVLVAATVAFILAHSLQGSEGSWQESNAVAAVLEPVMRRLYAFSGWLAAWTGHDMPLTYGEFVRKVAHFAEYSLLGVECAGLTVALAGRGVSPYLWACLFSALAIAVVDEYVQAFVGRTSLVSDVVLDFCGALMGIAVVLAMVGVARHFRYAGQHSSS